MVNHTPELLNAALTMAKAFFGEKVITDWEDPNQKFKESWLKAYREGLLSFLPVTEAVEQAVENAWSHFHANSEVTPAINYIVGEKDLTKIPEKPEDHSRQDALEKERKQIIDSLVDGGLAGKLMRIHEIDEELKKNVQ